MQNYDEYRSPLLDTDTKLEVAIGAIMFRDKTIENLRMQIVALRRLAERMYESEDIDDAQYQHLG